MTPPAECGDDIPRDPPPVRWIAVVLCVTYGFAKLTDAQFTVLESELTKPLGEVSGFWLTWHYFGYSPIYGSLIALAQIGGGILLALPRTAMLGALVLLPVIGNIVLVNTFYGIDLGATVAALVILGCLLSVIVPHVTRLRQAVLLPPSKRYTGVRLGALALLLVGAGGGTWWIANYNNRLPTRLDGVWSVVESPTNGGAPWRHVFFERNRAHWVTFRRADGTDERHHFEVDEHGVVRIWQTWLAKGPLIMQGRLAGDGQLELEEVGDAGNRRMTLRQEKRLP